LPFLTAFISPKIRAKKYNNPFLILRFFIHTILTPYIVFNSLYILYNG